MNALNAWKVVLILIAALCAFVAYRLRIPPAMISFAGISAYAGTAFCSFIAFLLLPKSKKAVAAKILIIIGLGFLVHRFMNDIDQSIRKTTLK